jgi:hypothetical protein
MWWQPGATSRMAADTSSKMEPIFYRIQVDRITGLIGTPA